MLMNVQPQFITAPEYRKFKRRIGAYAMEYIVLIGLRCQQTKSSTLSINGAEDLELILDIDEGGQELLDALISSGLVDPEGGEYRCLFFEQMNGQLLSNWRNGQLKSIQSKSNKLNPTQTNSTQLNSTECLGTARAMGKQCLDDEMTKPF